MNERRACKVLSQPRSTQRFHPKKGRDRLLTKRMHELAREQPRYGYRRIAVLLRREGWTASETRVHCLSLARGRPAGPAKEAQATPPGQSENGSLRLRATHPNHVWSYDFLFDATPAAFAARHTTRIKEQPVPILT